MLSGDQLDCFARDGYVVVPHCVATERLAAATAAVARLTREHPPPPGRVGAHFYWPDAMAAPDLFAIGESLLGPAGELVGRGTVEVAFDQTQVALNIPPYSHRPGAPHIDGYQPDATVPGSFTLLACLLLSDQQQENTGNLWVWPGTHRTHAAFFREQGPEAFFTAQGYPDIALPKPAQVVGRRGDVLLAHYLLGHNIGGNYAGDATRVALYWRLRKRGHAARWRECLSDHTLEFDGLTGHW